MNGNLNHKIEKRSLQHFLPPPINTPMVYARSDKNSFSLSQNSNNENGTFRQYALNQNNLQNGIKAPTNNQIPIQNTMAFNQNRTTSNGLSPNQSNRRENIQQTDYLPAQTHSYSPNIQPNNFNVPKPSNKLERDFFDLSPINFNQNNVAPAMRTNSNQNTNPYQNKNESRLSLPIHPAPVSFVSNGNQKNNTDSNRIDNATSKSPQPPNILNFKFEVPKSQVLQKPKIPDKRKSSLKSAQLLSLKNLKSMKKVSFEEIPNIHEVESYKEFNQEATKELRGNNGKEFSLCEIF